VLATMVACKNTKIVSFQVIITTTLQVGSHLQLPTLLPSKWLWSSKGYGPFATPG